jgi:glycosyltransferase involved in cell wall biosynthesis
MIEKPFVSVVIETINPRFDSDSPTGSLAADLAVPLRGLQRQTYPRERFEIIVVIDGDIGPSAEEELRQQFPFVKLVRDVKSNYFSAKNAGARSAAGPIIALLDGDCEPQPDWMDALVSRFDDGAGVVAGRTRYSGDSIAARTLSVPDFTHVGAEADGSASAFVLNNVAFRRDVFLTHPLDERIPRNGGCSLLYNQLRADGVTIVYEPRAGVAHRLDLGGLRYFRKHFYRGYDVVSVYRCDDRGVLRGTSFYRRFGPLALVPISARRIALDWLRLVNKRRQIGISLAAVPYYAAVALGTRLIQLAGALTAGLSRRG